MRTLAACLFLFLALPSTGRAEATRATLTLEALWAKTRSGGRAKAARHAVDLARARQDQALGAAFPKVELSSFLGPSPEIRCVNDECTQTSPTDVAIALEGLYGGGRISLVQPLYTFGKIDALKDAASHGEAASRHTQRAVLANVAFEAAQAYYGLKLARELGFMLEDGLEQIDSAQEKVDQKVAEGRGEATVQDRLRLATLRAEVAARLTEIRAKKATALAAVRALARDPQADIDDAPLEPRPHTLPKAEAAAQAGRRGRPDLLAAKEGAQAVASLAEVAEAQMWPDLLFGASAAFSRAQGVDNPPSAFAADPFHQNTVAAGLVLRWTLDFMTQQGRVAEARARVRETDALVRDAEEGAAFDATRLWAEATQAQARWEASLAGERAARGWLASVIQAEAIGALEAKDLVDAYVAYFTSRSRVLSSIVDWNLAVVRLEQVTSPPNP